MFITFKKFWPSGIFILLYASVKSGYNATHNLHTSSWDTWHPLFPDQTIFYFHMSLLITFATKLYLPSETYMSYKFYARYPQKSIF